MVFSNADFNAGVANQKRFTFLDFEDYIVVRVILSFVGGVSFINCPDSSQDSVMVGGSSVGVVFTLKELTII